MTRDLRTGAGFDPGEMNQPITWLAHGLNRLSNPLSHSGANARALPADGVRQAEPI